MQARQKNIYSMTQKQKDRYKKNIERLIKRSYEDDGNTYEIEFRCMLESVLSDWDKLTGIPK